MIVHDPFQSFAKGCYAEVHKQSERLPGQPQVGEELLPMDRRESLYRLHFDDESASDEKIGSEPLAQEHAFIFDVDKLLPLHGHSPPKQTGFEHRFIDRLK
jgi:hypothetical protein